MALTATEIQSGGLVRDADGRIVISGGGAGVGTAGVPAGGTAVFATSGNVANATAAATLAAAAGKFTYLTSFQVTASGATAASVVTIQIFGAAGTFAFTLAVPAGVTLGAAPLVVAFPVPVPSSAVNTGVQVNVPALGAGNTNATVSAQGFTL